MLPEFLDRDERASRDKDARMAPIVERALARKPAGDHPPLPTADYEFPAIPRSVADRDRSDGFHAWLDEYARSAAAGTDVSRRLAKPGRDGP